MAEADGIRRHPARRAGLIAAGYAALSVAYTWPLILHLSRGVAHDLGDPLLNAWILWWSTRAVPLTASWWSPPAFYPAAGTLAFSEHLLGLIPISAPLTFLTGQPLVGYNVALLATFALSGMAAHYLAFTLTRRHDAAFVAGVAFAFAPYRLAQVSHIQVVASWFTPLCLAALHRYGRTAKPRWAILAAAAWLLQALACGYFLFFLSVLLALWLLWFALGRWSGRQIAVVCACFVVAATLLIPILSAYQSILRDTYGLKRSIGEIRLFSADVAGLLFATDELLIWGWVHLIQRPESTLFPGLTIVLLSALAVVQVRPFATAADESPRMAMLRRTIVATLILLSIATIVPLVHGPWNVTLGGARLISISRADKPLSLALVAALITLAMLPRVRVALAQRSPLAFYLLAAFAMWVFALGPDPTFFNERVLYQSPYGQLMRLPGFDGLRVPARFWMMSLVCLSAIAALAVNKISARSRTVVVVAAAVGLLADGWPRGFTVVPAPEIRASPTGVSARLDLPLNSDTDARALYQQMFDPVPLYNGFSGYFAPHYYALRTLLEASDPRILQVLAADGPLGVVIDHASDQDGALRRFVLTYPGAQVVHDSRGWSSYRLPKSPEVPRIADRTGAPLRIKTLSTFPSPPHAARALDGDLSTRWSGGVQQVFAEVVIELEQISHVEQVEIDLGGFTTDFPKRLQIDVSIDGQAWETAWVGDSALHAYYGALRHPREMPLVFELNRNGVGFIRLRQTGFGKNDWSIAELSVRQ